MKFLQDLPNVDSKKVLLRADFDVPVENGVVGDQTRIKADLPSIRWLLKRNAKVVLLAHLGRPNKVEKEFSLKPVAQILENILKVKIKFLKEPTVSQLSNLNLLENLRFWSGEEANDEIFTKKLVVMGDFYINDAFAVCHRLHASIVGIPKFLPGFAGLHLEKEINELTKILKNPARPLVAIIGGAKIETKLPSINNLSKIADKVLVGGRLMFEIGNTPLNPNVIVANDDLDTKDIGPRSIEFFSRIVKNAKTIIWNGPLGLFEEEKYALGTKKVAKEITNSNAYSIIGGGDTIAALNKFDLLDKINYVSTGGGAMLEILAGKKLPGLEALENSKL